MSIFETSRSPADELGTRLRESLKRAIHAFPGKQEGFAQELSKRSGRTITPGLLNAWTAETKHRWHLPADIVPIVCEILRDDSIQRLLLSEKLKQSLDLGESVPQVVSLLRGVLPEKTGSEKFLAASKIVREARPHAKVKSKRPPKS